MTQSCWALPNEGYLAVGPLSASLAIITEGDAPIRFLTNSFEYARMQNGIWNFNGIHTPSTFQNGQSWMDADYGSFVDVPAGRMQLRKGIFCCQANTVTIQNTITETSFVGVGFGSTTLPANFLVPGKSIRLTARGTIIRAAGDFNIRCRIGGVDVLSTGNVTFTGFFTSYLEIHIDIVCRSTGSNNVILQGAVGANVGIPFGMVGSPVTIDITQELTMDLTGEWSVANAGNIATCSVLIAEV